MTYVKFVDCLIYKDIIYYKKKYHLSDELIDEFENYWDNKDYFNGEKIGVEDILILNNEIIISYFKTDYKTSIFVRNFLLKQIKMDVSDRRCSLGFNLLIKDMNNNLMLTSRVKDWHGNIILHSEHYQLSTSEGIDIDDIIDFNISNMIRRSILEELGIDLSYYQIINVGFYDDNNSSIVSIIEIEDLSTLDLDLDLSQSLDYKNNIIDIKKYIIINNNDIEYNNNYSDILNQYILNNIKYIYN